MDFAVICRVETGQPKLPSGSDPPGIGVLETQAALRWPVPQERSAAVGRRRCCRALPDAYTVGWCLVYALLAWLVTKLVRLLLGETRTGIGTSTRTVDSDPPR